MVLVGEQRVVDAGCRLRVGVAQRERAARPRRQHRDEHAEPPVHRDLGEHVQVERLPGRLRASALALREPLLVGHDVAGGLERRGAAASSSLGAKISS